MKVVFDGRTIADRYPGIGRYAFGLARALTAHIEVELITDPEAVNTRYDLASIAATRLAVRARPGSLAAQWLIPRAAAQSRAEIYHSPFYMMGFYFSRVNRPVSRVVTFYDLIPLSPAAGFSPAGRLLYRLAHRAAARVAKRVIVLSQAARDSFVKTLGLDPEKMAIIAPGIDPTFRPRPAAEIERLRVRLGLPGTFLLCVGTNKPHKNLVRLVQACARLPGSAPPMLLAGPEDPRYPEARAAVEALGLASRARFLGQIAEADLPALYAAAALCVFPSLEEGFGFPVVEAMACGAPVACSTAPGLAEAAGSAAAVFNPMDCDAIAATIWGVLTDTARREELKTLSVGHAASFSWEPAAQDTVRLYETAIRER